MSSTKVKSDDDWLSSTSGPSPGSGRLEGEEDKETVDVKKLKEEYIRSHSFLEVREEKEEGERQNTQDGGKARPILVKVLVVREVTVDRYSLF